MQLLFATSKIMLRRHICLSRISDCNFFVYFKSQRLRASNWQKLNKMNWTVVTQTLSSKSKCMDCPQGQNKMVVVEVADLG